MPTEIDVLDASSEIRTIKTNDALLLVMATAAAQATGNATLAALVALLPTALGAGGGLKVAGVPPTKVTGAATALAASTHAAGVSAGGKWSFPDAALAGGGGIIIGAIVRDKAGNEIPYELQLFDSDPSAATITDDLPFAFNADLAKNCGTITFAGMGKGGTPGSISMGGLGLPFRLASGTTLYGGLVVGGSGATYTSSSDLSIDLFII